jgi:hypothetical protein
LIQIDASLARSQSQPNAERVLEPKTLLKGLPLDPNDTRHLDEIFDDLRSEVLARVRSPTDIHLECPYSPPAP